MERTHQNVEKILFHETTILARLDELAWEITQEYEGKNLTVIAILHGGIMFMADLLRRIPLPLKMETITVSSYHGGTTSSGTVTFHQDKLPNLKGEHVLLLDDILDTGRTLKTIGEKIAEQCDPTSVRSCVLLDKKVARVVDQEASFVGFEVGNEFVIGYGLDYEGRYRNLPYIGVLKEEVYYS